MEKWISVKDKHPENQNEVLVLITDVAAVSVRTVGGRKCGFGFAWYADGEWYLEGASYFDGKRSDLMKSDIAQHITHWMPLPEIPELEPLVIIRPNDLVLHKPSGETWRVLGVDRSKRELIPYNDSFPTIVSMDECELIEERYLREYQPAGTIRELYRADLVRFVDVRSALYHEII